jgi:hypothetical protein
VVELGALPDDLDDLDFRTMSLGKDIVSDPAVFDTGASHGFTGSKTLLHSFRYLANPIPVSVATNGGGAKITGIGDLKFRGPNGQVIVLKHVLYCEHARTTLISMAALRKANATVHYDNLAEAFRVYHLNGSHLFSCVFEPKKNRWCMPYPMIKVGSPQTCNQRKEINSVAVHHISSSIVSSASPIFSHNSSFFPNDMPAMPANLNENSPISIFASKAVTSSEIFKEPVGKSINFQWKPEKLTQDEISLLFWHRVFGHASLRHIR